MSIIEEIYFTLTDKLSAQYLTVDDESALHVAHAEAKKSKGGHYNVTIVSEQFNGKNLLKRHRLVYDILKAEFKEKIHALSVRAYTPDEWNKIQST